MLRKIVFTIMLVSTFVPAFARVSQQKADSIASLLSQREIVCDKACPLFDSEKSHAGVVNTIFIDILAVIGTVWLYSNYRKKYFILFGSLLVLMVSGSLLFKRSNSQCVEYSKASCLIVTDKKVSAAGSLSDFKQMDSTDVIPKMKMK